MRNFDIKANGNVRCVQKFYEIIKNSCKGFEHKMGEYQIIFTFSYDTYRKLLSLYVNTLSPRRIDYILNLKNNETKAKITQISPYYESIGRIIGIIIKEHNYDGLVYQIKFDNGKIFNYKINDFILVTKNTPTTVITRSKIEIEKLIKEIKLQKKKEKEEKRKKEEAERKAKEEELNKTILLNDFGQELKLNKIIIIFNNKERKMVYGKISGMLVNGFDYTTQCGKKYQCRSYQQTYVPDDQESAEQEMALQALRKI